MTVHVQHVFFDVTDTLLRVRGSVGEIYSRVAARFGLMAPAAAIDASFARAIATLPQNVAAGLPEAEIRTRERGWWHAIVHRTFEPCGDFPRFEAFFDEVFQLFRTRAAWELVPGVPETLHALREQKRGLGIISDMDSRLDDALAAFGIGDLFAPVCLSFRVGYRKPDARLFRAAAKSAGVAPGQAAHVGDSLQADVRGALEAGLVAIHLDERSGGGAPPAAHVISSIKELPDLLARLDAAGDHAAPADCR